MLEIYIGTFTNLIPDTHTKLTQEEYHSQISQIKTHVLQLSAETLTYRESIYLGVKPHFRRRPHPSFVIILGFIRPINSQKRMYKQCDWFPFQLVLMLVWADQGMWHQIWVLDIKSCILQATQSVTSHCRSSCPQTV